MKKVLITILLIIEIFMINLTYQSFLHKEITKEENKITNKQFAMYIKEKDEYVEYKEDNLFPKGYYVNKALSKCVDEKGNPVENVISSLGTNVTVSSNKTIYCTLYFDKNEILEYLRSKDTNGLLSADIVGDMYRYQGVSEEYASDELKVVDNNYICLGEDCSEYGEDLYRIIGVTETGELKVIKKTVLSKSYPWYDDSYIDIKWPDSLIYHGLNDDSDSFYNTLDSKLQEKIINHKWMYGDAIGQEYDGDLFYKIESGDSATRYFKKTEDGYELSNYTWDKNKDYVIAKIGLQYIHDYLLAYPGGKPGTAENASKSWIFFLNNDDSPISIIERLMTRFGCGGPNGTDSPYLAKDIYGQSNLIGELSGNFFNQLLSLRPVFYLSSDILITGEGTLMEPFKIGLEDEKGNETFEYPFKGNYETFTIFKDGTYQIELWGAKGGGDNGGLGAYTKGNIELKKNDKLYIYVGENPVYTSGSCVATNPNSSFNCSKNGSCAGGGGATDIRLEKGEWNNFDSLKSRIMVAAGGGGYYSGYGGYGGYGGTLTGGDAEGFESAYTDHGGYGATQEKYKFGYSVLTTCIAGNGYYSGESGHGANAGGGSSYISGYPGCKAITKESTENNITHSDSPNHYSGKVFFDPVMIAGNDTMPNYNGGTMVGNSGNGYARITKIN